MDNEKMTIKEKREIIIEQDKERRRLANEQRNWIYNIIKKDGSLRIVHTQ